MKSSTTARGRLVITPLLILLASSLFSAAALGKTVSSLEAQINKDESLAAENEKMRTMLGYAMDQDAERVASGNSTAGGHQGLFMEHTAQAMSRKKQPQVRQFAQNIITEQYFTDSVYNAYLNAFFTGYNMYSYNQADTCEEYFGEFLNGFHQMNLNVTRLRNYTDPYNLAFEIAGNEFNEAWFNCYRFYVDFRTDYKERFAEFNDFGDLYLSFIFNMLSNSLTIRTQTNNMIESYNTHQTADFVQSLASILRSILVFNSYNEDAGALSPSPTYEEFLGLPRKRRTSTKEERAAQWDADRIAARQRLEEYRAEEADYWEQRKQSRQTRLNRYGPGSVALAEDYKWKARDYVQAPLALLVGSLHALPASSNGPKCSSNTTEFRSYLIESFDYFELKEKIDGAQSLYVGLTLIDEVGIYCHDAIVTDLSKQHFIDLFDNWYGVPENLLYNAGYMWVDFINYVFYTPETVPDNDWGFFTLYLAGDFVMRIFYHDPSPQSTEEYQ